LFFSSFFPFFAVFCVKKFFHVAEIYISNGSMPNLKKFFHVYIAILSKKMKKHIPNAKS